MAVLPLTRELSTTTDTLGSLPKVVNRYDGASLSSMSQSTPSIVTHGNVDAVGASTPHHSNTEAGSPHAPVACAVVERRASSGELAPEAPSGPPPMLSGSFTLTLAQSADFACAAGVITTVPAHPESTVSAVLATANVVTGRRSKVESLITLRLT